MIKSTPENIISREHPTVMEEPRPQFLPRTQWLYLVALTTSPMIFLYFIAPYLAGPAAFFWRDGSGLLEDAEWMIFLLGWPTVLAASSAYAWLLKAWDDRSGGINLPLIAVTNAIISVAALAALFTLRGKDEMLNISAWFPYRDRGDNWAKPASIIWFCTAVWVIANLALLGASSTKNVQRWARASSILLPLLALIWLGLVFGYPVSHAVRSSKFHAMMGEALIEPPRYKFAWMLAIASGAIGAALLTWRPFRIPRALARTLEIVIIVLFVLIMVDVSGFVDRYHTPVYLLPANAVMHGRSAPNEVVPLYGVGLTYFLAGFFKLGLLPYTWNGMTLLTCSLSALLFGCLYGTMRITTGQKMLSLLLATGYILWQYHAYYVVIPEYHPFGLPQGAAFRIIIPAGTVFMLAARLWSSGIREKVFRGAEALLVAVSTVWSVESLCYTVPIFCAVLALELFDKNKGPLPRRLKGIAFSVAIACAFAILLQVLIGLHNYHQTGQWTNWSAYTYLLFNVSALAAPVVPWGPWQMVTGVLFAGALFAVFTFVLYWKSGFPRHLYIAVAGTLLGLGYFTYYLAFSQSLRLTYVCYGPCIVAATGLALLTRGSIPPRKSWQSIALAFYIGMYSLTPAFLFLLKPYDVNPWSYSILKQLLLPARKPVEGKPTLKEIFGPIPLWPKVVPVDEMIRQQVPAGRKVAIFAQDARRLELLMTTGRDFVYPLASTEHDGTEPLNVARIRASKLDLRPGDIVFEIPRDEPEIMKTLMNDVRSSFTLEQVPLATDEAQAYRVKEKR